MGRLILEASPEDIAYIGANLRAADRAECEALGLDPDTACARAAATCLHTDVGIVNGEPLCLFGVGTPMAFGSTARPWMLGTEGVARHRSAFLRESRGVVDRWRDRYTLLENWIDARNTMSIAWLRWLGFTIDEPHPLGPLGLPFHRFSMRR